MELYSFGTSHFGRIDLGRARFLWISTGYEDVAVKNAIADAFFRLPAEERLTQAAVWQACRDLVPTYAGVCFGEAHCTDSERVIRTVGTNFSVFVDGAWLGCEPKDNSVRERRGVRAMGIDSHGLSSCEEVELRLPLASSGTVFVTDMADIPRTLDRKELTARFRLVDSDRALEEMEQALTGFASGALLLKL